MKRKISKFLKKNSDLEVKVKLKIKKQNTIKFRKKSPILI
jgi:hypothetical protein